MNESNLTLLLFVVTTRQITKIFQKLGAPGLYPEAFLAARRDALWVFFPALFYVAAMVYTAVQYYGSHESSADGESRALAEAKKTAYEEDDTAIWLCLGGAVASVAGTGFVVLFCLPSDGSHKKFTVPMNIGYCIHRYGEWTMLMLGETVLSLLIVNLSEGYDYYLTFFSGVISIILLEYLHFRSQPHDPDEHALRRDKNSGFVFLVLMQVYSASLIILGASYKMLLYEYVYAEDGNRRMLLPALTRLLAAGESAALRFETDDRRQRIANFFCGSMALVFFCMDAMAIAHRGISANVHRCEFEATQKTRYWVVFLIALRVAVIGFIASLSQYTTAPDVLAFVGLCGILVQLFLRVMGSFAFPVNEEEEEAKVFERIAVHSAARVRQSNT
jgi:xanthosine utilization system XapX-like protein